MPIFNNIKERGHMYKEHYSRFLSKHPDTLYFNTHSHHIWPDVTRDAVLQYWDDSASYVDDKWRDLIFQKVIPEAQSHIAKILNLSSHNMIAFAPNTHEFIVRLVSCLNLSKRVKIVTTDSEFISFERQISSLEKSNFGIDVVRVPVMPYHTFSDRFRAEASGLGSNDMIFVSQVFFNTGFHPNLDYLYWLIMDITKNPLNRPIIVVDGYHGFCAVPTNLRNFFNHIFYIAGGYKYAQSGEGACFMTVPPNCYLRPINTGWFTEFRSFKKGFKASSVTFPYDGFRFWGATFDPTGLYRFNAVMNLFKELGLTIDGIHRHIAGLQELFLEELIEIDHPKLYLENMATPNNPNIRGHFLSFNIDNATRLVEGLRSVGVVVDSRDQFLRFGFGLYHDEDDVHQLIEKIKNI
jgi:selenocysteine lyase/cysteine desulfurase